MYHVKIEGHFSSAHNLRDYKGKCEELHGHNWKVELCVSSGTLDKTGMVIDFHILKKELNVVLEKLDHTYLNNTDYFKEVNPTSENIAKYIFDQMRSRLTNMKSVTVWENHASCAIYEE